MIGLAGLISFAIHINWEVAYASGRLHLFAGIMVIMAGLTLAFLFPPLHQRVLRSTFPIPARLIFTLLSIIWLTVSLSYARQTGGFDTALTRIVQENHNWAIWATIVLFALLIFPFGIGYGELREAWRAERDARMMEKENASPKPAPSREAAWQAKTGANEVSPEAERGIRRI